MTLNEIYTLAVRYVPIVAAEPQLYGYAKSWRPAHELGHFLIATRAECKQPFFGLDLDTSASRRAQNYVIVREIAAMSISQRLLHRSGYPALADEEVLYTDELTLECTHEKWCQRSVRVLLKKQAVPLPATAARLEKLLARKAEAVRTPVFPCSVSAETAYHAVRAERSSCPTN